MLNCNRKGISVPELAIIVPTYNERKNLIPLTECLAKALADIDYEVIFVDDDSTDNTSAAARSLAQADSRIRVLQRIGRRGLASAVVEGMLASSALFLAVIDADLQHDERALPAMLQKIKDENLDVVEFGTRNAGGGSIGRIRGRARELKQSRPFLELHGVQGSHYGPDEWILRGAKRVLSLGRA